MLDRIERSDDCRLHVTIIFEEMDYVVFEALLHTLVLRFQLRDAVFKFCDAVSHQLAPQSDSERNA